MLFNMRFPDLLAVTDEYQGFVRVIAHYSGVTDDVREPTDREVGKILIPKLQNASREHT